MDKALQRKIHGALMHIIREVHSIDENQDVEKARGGSHGIGKIASNAASDLHIMYFANCDEEGNKNIGGTVQLIEHKYGEKYYRSTGYFTDINDNDKFYPYENNFGEVFSKDTRGLKIIIPFLREQFNSEKEVIKSVCSNFFIAILEKQLEVEVNDKLINDTTIVEYIKNQEYYEQDLKEIKKEFTPLYFDTYKNIEPRKLKISAGVNINYEFDLYFNYNENISKGRVGIIRTIGMKIEDKKIRGNVNKPFNAILIPSSSEEDVFLKSLENESHTAISFDHIKDLITQKKAKTFIKHIDKVIAEILEEEIKKNNPTDGVIDTKDILYIVESQFKKELSKNISTVKLSEGTKKETEIVKVTAPINKLVNERKDDLEESTKNRGKSDETEKKKRQPKKVKDKKPKEVREGKKKVRYATYPDTVERIIVGSKEFIKFNFSESNELKKEKICDIVFAIVDGMGNEYEDEFNAQENYSYSIDKTSGEKCKLEKDRVTNLEIKKGIVQIELGLKSNFNKVLKFVYYVEV